MKFITPLPYIILILFTFLSYLIYKQKLKAVGPKVASSVIAMLWLIIVIAVISFFANPDRYESYIGKYIVPGKMVSKIVTVEADEGPNTWEEKRTYWQPNTKTGETIMNMIVLFNLAIVVGSIILNIKFYSKTKERENQLKKKNRYLPDYD